MNSHASQLQGAEQTALTLQEVGRDYGELQVLDGVNLSIRAGEAVVIIGRSGCGKSTLLRLLADLDRPDRGAIELAGRPLSEARQHIRLMFQDARLLPWKSVLDNVMLGIDQFNLARYALDEVALADRARDWPSTLSGGQRQRVALARALAHRPDLLLLDEPLGALDALTRISMHRLIEQLWREHGFTLVMVTHDVSEAVTLADRVILLEEGRVAMDLNIELPRPRVPAAPRFVAYQARILGRLLGDQAHAPQQPEPKSKPRASRPGPVFQLAI